MLCENILHSLKFSFLQFIWFCLEASAFVELNKFMNELGACNVGMLLCSFIFFI